MSRIRPLNTSDWDDKSPPKFSSIALLSGFLLGLFILSCIAVTVFFIHLIFS
jgi:hypothetical protein